MTRTYVCENPYCANEYEGGPDEKVPPYCPDCGLSLRESAPKPKHVKHKCEDCASGGEHGPERD